MAIPRISMSWQKFVSSDICVERKDPVNVSVRRKKKSSYLIKHQKVHAGREIKVHQVRKASVRPCSQSRVLQKHPVLVQLASVQLSLGGGGVLCRRWHFIFFNKKDTLSEISLHHPTFSACGKKFPGLAAHRWGFGS